MRCAGALRMKAPSCEGAMLIGPLRRSAYSSAILALPQSGEASALSVRTPSTLNTARICRWSCRLAPTPGRSRTTAMPCCVQQPPGRCRRAAGSAACRCCRRTGSLRARRAPSTSSVAVSRPSRRCSAGRRRPRLEQQPRHLRAGPQLEVRAAVAGGPQEGLGGVPAPAALLVDLEVADALVVAAVEVLDVRNAGLLRGLRERVEDVPAQPLLLDAPLAAGAVQSSSAPQVVVLVR